MKDTITSSQHCELSKMPCPFKVGDVVSVRMESFKDTANHTQNPELVTPSSLFHIDVIGSAFIVATDRSNGNEINCYWSRLQKPRLEIKLDDNLFED
jgi:hypothetical protein